MAASRYAARRNALIGLAKSAIPNYSPNAHENPLRCNGLTKQLSLSLKKRCGATGSVPTEALVPQRFSASIR
jgi:hypothetical protein